MTLPDDPEDMLHRFVSDDDADRLLSGRAGDGGDDGLSDVAALFAAMRAGAAPTGRLGAEVLVARMAAAVEHGSNTDPAGRRRPVVARLLTAKTIALTGALVLSAGAAAAATGTLPDPVQRSVAQAVAHVGIHVPSPDDTEAPSPAGDEPVPAGASTVTASSATAAPGSTRPGDRTSPSAGVETSDAASTSEGTPSAPAGPSAGTEPGTPGRAGLCRAWLAGGGQHGDPTAFQALIDAAAAAGTTVDELCAATVASAPSVPDDHGHDTSAPGSTAGGAPGSHDGTGTAPPEGDGGGSGRSDHPTGTTPTTAHDDHVPGTPPTGTSPSDTRPDPAPGGDHGPSTGTTQPPASSDPASSAAPTSAHGNGNGNGNGAGSANSNPGGTGQGGGGGAGNGGANRTATSPSPSTSAGKPSHG